MQVTIERVPILPFETTRQPIMSTSDLEGCRVTAMMPSASTDYLGLLDACLAKVSSTLSRLHAEGYIMWLMISGAALTPEQRATYPNYSIFNPAEKLGINGGRKLQQTFHRDGKLRTAGFYEVGTDQLAAACQLMIDGEWNFAILSHRTEFPNSDDLRRLYHLVDLTGEDNPAYALNWPAAATLVAPYEDVVMRTFGSSDDKYRSLIFAFSKTAAVAEYFPQGLA